MKKYDSLELIYKNILKPLYFAMDPEFVHNLHTYSGELLGNYAVSRKLIDNIFNFSSVELHQSILGVDFPNPLGLAAGFDYDGHLASILSNIGFGFNTVGTVTAKPYEGNAKPRMLRLPKSHALLVNKGFKSSGVSAIRERLDKKHLDASTLGISVGSSNIPAINTINSAIDDYIFTFNAFKDRSYVKYFELNISCPNTTLTENFTNTSNFKKLILAVGELNIKKPIFVKMPNEIDVEHCYELVDITIGQGINNFIFSNLIKDRSNNSFDQNEIKALSKRKGNFSGKPTEENSLKLIYNNKKRYKNDIIIVGCGGTFCAMDAIKKIRMGANLVQFITGMVFEGPQMVGKANYEIKKYLYDNNFENISQLVGIDAN